MRFHYFGATVALIAGILVAQAQAPTPAQPLPRLRPRRPLRRQRRLPRSQTTSTSSAT